MEATRRKSFVPSSSSVICEKHFSISSFHLESLGGKTKKLKKDSVPTVFDFPNQPSDPKKCRRTRTSEKASRPNSPPPGASRPTTPPLSPLPALPESPTHDPHLPSAPGSSGPEPPDLESTLSSEETVQDSDSLMLMIQHKNLSLRYHQYTKPETPTKDKLRKKVKRLQDKLRRKEKIVDPLEDLVAKMKEQSLISSDCSEIILERFSGIPLEFFIFFIFFYSGGNVIQYNYTYHRVT